MKLKLSTRRLTRGITLLEVLIALGVGSLILGLAFSITMSSRSLFETDRSKTALVQNVRSVVDIIGSDIRIAGERLHPRDDLALWPLVIVDGSEIIVRRNHLDTTLALCEWQLNDNSVRVVRNSNASIDWSQYPLCDPAGNDANGNGVHDGFEAFQAYRQANGGMVRAYIYKPNGQGEFFFYNNENAANFELLRPGGGSGGGLWQFTYQMDEHPRIVLLNELRYRLNDGYLELIRDGDVANPVRLAADIERFEVRAIMRDGSVLTNLDRTSGVRWRDVASIELAVTSADARVGSDLERTLRANFLPRNTLSN